MIPIWLALLLSWVLWAIILFVGNNRLGFSFQNEKALYIFCAPVVIPIFVIVFPAALCIRCFNELKYYFEKRRKNLK
jgi:uncharacterized membrane protein YbjE (DUF340 family)